MGKHDKLVGHTPKASKGALVAAAKEQVKKNEDLVRLTNADNSTSVVLTEEALAAAAGKAVLQAIADVQEGKAVDVTPSPEEKKEVQAAVTVAKTAPAPELLTLGKRYAPKTDRNSETWGKITKALAEGPKSLGQLAEIVKGHGDFLGYMKRGGHLVPFVEQKEPVAN